MVDFLMISTRANKGSIEIYPKFIIKKSSDLMVRGGDFYAVWREDLGLWSTDEQDALQLIDMELDKYAQENRSRFPEGVRVLHMWDSENRMIDRFHRYVQKDMRDNFHMLDERIIFSNTEVSKKDYASKKLSYPLEAGSFENYDKLMSVLYSPEERHKIEWAIGSIVNGDSKKLQKFLVLYGAAGTGKSTVLNIIQELFEGYYSVFDAKALGTAGNQFALEAFKTNPLIAIQHDGDLSRIEDNTRLNSLVSHEMMQVNEKHKNLYSNRFKAFLFMGTNKPVKITDNRSGLLRRLIDVTPTGEKVGLREYRSLTKKIDFELGAIAWHCKAVYEADPNYYDHYIPVNMMRASNEFYNFVVDCFYELSEEDEISVKKAWTLYKKYCEDANIKYPYSQPYFKEELLSYYKEFDGKVYRYFKKNIFKKNNINKKENIYKIELHEQPSILDDICASLPAQYADGDKPQKAWRWVKTTLKDLDTSQIHYLKLPPEHIVLDFDFKNEKGEKDLERNIEEASKFPPTYTETSKSGGGLHLHYIYTGDPEELENKYSENIEIKVSKGNAALRRKLYLCNSLAIAKISSGLPLKKKKGERMISEDTIKSERGLRELIKRNLRKEIHPGTKPSIDFIKKILDEAYESGLHYDISDMRDAVLSFAAKSTNQAGYCIKEVNKMKFKSEEIGPAVEAKEEKIIFFDIEIFPNLFIICWKLQGDNPVVQMINPKPEDVEQLFKYRLVGFNNRDYDNHMVYAAANGYSVKQLYKLSQRIIAEKDPNAKFREAFNLSYTDVYDFSSKKQSLKKWEIELGISHIELAFPWDQEVPEEKWQIVADYCKNDVLATEAVFDHCQGDFTARKILAELAGGTPNDKTNTLTTKIIFGNEKHPPLVYVDLSKEFPGYEYVEEKVDGKIVKHNMYRGEDAGFGGYNYAVPGIYGRTTVFDVAGEHPSSIRAMNCLGDKGTKRFGEMVDLRTAIKHKDFETAKTMLDGKVAKYLDDPATAKQLSQALKIANNSVYGLTSASFDNPFRDKRNINNIVALRGALFMINLRDEVVSRGFTVINTKTDSIKVVNADQEISDFIFSYGKKYGYNFEIENIFERICITNKAAFIAKCADDDPDPDLRGKWFSKATQFNTPYVFKTLFSKEEIIFEDLCEVKSVKEGEIWIDMNEDLPEGEHNYIFVGRVGQFTPIKEGCGGGVLYRKKDGKYYAVAGTKKPDDTPYRWMESEMVKELHKEDDIDISYYERLCDDVVAAINKYGSYENFVNDKEIVMDDFSKFMNVPTGDPEEVPFEGSYVVEKQ